MIKYMNQYAPDSEELREFEQWWKEQYEEALRRQESTVRAAATLLGIQTETFLKEILI